jgi:hypothetical protein
MPFYGVAGIVRRRVETRFSLADEDTVQVFAVSPVSGQAEAERRQAWPRILVAPTLVCPSFSPTLHNPRGDVRPTARCIYNDCAIRDSMLQIEERSCKEKRAQFGRAG